MYHYRAQWNIVWDEGERCFIVDLESVDGVNDAYWDYTGWGLNSPY